MVANTEWMLCAGADLALGEEAWLGREGAPLAGGRGLMVGGDRCQAVAELRAGDTLADPKGPVALVLARTRLCPADGRPAAAAAQVRLLRNVPVGAVLRAEVRRTGPALAWVTLSDTGFAGQRVDGSGPKIAELVGRALPLSLSRGFVLPDEGGALRALLLDLALFQGFDFVCTTGGTGITSRDVTPEATLAVIERRLPGMERVMTMASLAKTPHAVLSRAVAGTLGHCLILNLPGSPKAVTECLEPLLPALPHALAKLAGDASPCGG